MNKITPPRLLLVALSAALWLPVGAQGNLKTAAQLRAEQASHAPLLRQMLRVEPTQPPRAVQTPPLHAPAAGKSTALSPAKLGSASNALNWIRNQQTILHCDDNSGTLAHVHRQDISIWGGGIADNGRLRYDVSINRGASWSLDIGTLNPAYSRPARYPQCMGHGTDPNPLLNQLVWAAACRDTLPDWDGVVTGLSEVITSGTPSSTETYGFTGGHSHIPGSLCRRVDGEYWMVDMEYLGGNTFTGKFLLMKGTFDTVTSDVNWIITDTLAPPYDLTFDGSHYGTYAQMEWSPDGTVGWISMLGDLSGHHSYRPIFWKSVDSGASWSAPMEYDLNTESWVADSLQTLWVDSTGAPAGSGIGTTAFDHDLTVDVYGNAHMGVVVGNAPGAGGEYTLASGLAKFFADVYTTDGGASWKIMYMSPILTLQGEFGGATGSDPLIMENAPQVARNADGSKVFFMWADSDTNTIGFGENNNQAPNLRIAARNVTNNNRTCYKRITDGDILWGDQMLFPTMARQSLRDGSRDKLLTGFISFQIPNDELQPTDFWTLLNDTWIDDSEFFPDHWSVDLSWDTWCIFINQDESLAAGAGPKLHPPHPNPATDAATLTYELPQSAEVELVLCNLQGARLQVLASGAMPAGTHKVHLDTQGLAAGMYLYTLRVGDQRITCKLVVN